MSNKCPYEPDSPDYYEWYGDEWTKHIGKTRYSGELEEKWHLEAALSNYKLALDKLEEKSKPKGEEVSGPLTEQRGRILKKGRLVKFQLENLVNPPKILGHNKHTFFGILAIVTLLTSFIFISFDLTGAVIFDRVQESFGFLASSLFILGLILVFFYFKHKSRLKV